MARLGAVSCSQPKTRSMQIPIESALEVRSELGSVEIEDTRRSKIARDMHYSKRKGCDPSSEKKVMGISRGMDIREDSELA